MKTCYQTGSSIIEKKNSISNQSLRWSLGLLLVSFIFLNFSLSCHASSAGGKAPLLSDDVRPPVAQSSSNASTDDISDKLIYSFFFVEKDEWSYNEGMQKNFKRLGITGPLPYSIFSDELSNLNTRAQKAYREWQQRNPDEQDYVDLDFPDIKSNALKSIFDNQDGGTPFNITIMEIKRISDTKAEVILSCDSSETMIRLGDEGFEKLVDSDYGSADQETRILYLVKEDGKWKVDNLITEFKYDGEIEKFDWKNDLKSFITDPVKFMPYYEDYED